MFRPMCHVPFDSFAHKIRGICYTQGDAESQPLTTTQSSLYGVKEDERDMALGRLIARKLSKTTSWYNPSKNLNPIAKVKNGMILDGTITVPPPSLDEAWEFYEHQVLPRRFTGGDRKRAEPGESKEPTKLYSIFDTSLDDMGEFGIGVGMYVSTLVRITMIRR